MSYICWQKIFTAHRHCRFYVYLPPEYGTILRTFEPCLSSLVTEEVSVPASYIRPKTMFDRDGLFVKFSSTRVYPYIETLLSSQAYDVVICCWDLASNAMGRAYVLAEMLARDNNSVLVIAPAKGSKGSSLWPHFLVLTIVLKYLHLLIVPKTNFLKKQIYCHGQFDQIGHWSKSRPQSCLTAYLFGLNQNSSLFCDIDDYESAFYGNTSSMKQWKDSTKLSLLNSFYDETSQFNDERWINVSSVIADTFDDYIFACASMRRAYSNEHSPIVFHKRLPNCDDLSRTPCVDGHYRLVFHGTIRKHKGINHLLGFLAVHCDPQFRVELRLAAQRLGRFNGSIHSQPQSNDQNN